LAAVGGVPVEGVEVQVAGVVVVEGQGDGAGAAGVEGGGSADRFVGGFQGACFGGGGGEAVAVEAGGLDGDALQAVEVAAGGGAVERRQEVPVGPVLAHPVTLRGHARGHPWQGWG